MLRKGSDVSSSAGDRVVDGTLPEFRLASHALTDQIVEEGMAGSAFRVAECRGNRVASQLETASAGVDQISFTADLSQRFTNFSDIERTAGPTDHTAGIDVPRHGGRDQSSSVVFKAN